MPVHKINEIWAFVARIPGEDEGIPAIQGPNNMVLPMVASDLARVYELRKIAQDSAALQGIDIELRRFSLVEIVESFIGEANGQQRDSKEAGDDSGSPPEGGNELYSDDGAE